MTTIQELYNIYTQFPVVSTDTRKIEKGCLFFALKGPNFNANTFTKEALEKGAAYVIIDEKQYKINEQCLYVEDVLTSLQQLASYHRKQLNIPIIAIVGSNGKTTTKELITSTLSQKYKVLATPGNFNNHIGLPLTLLMLNKSHQIGIIEMGANHIGENALLCDIAMPSHGLVTNNGKDHLEGFGSMEGVAQSNSELYYYLWKNNGKAFVNANDEWLMRMASRLDDKITYAANDPVKNATADIVGIASSLRPEIIFSLLSDPGVEIKSSLSGDYNFDNIMAAVCAGKEFHLSINEIKKGIESYEPKNNRSQIIRKGSNTIYMDAYNANPSSMEVALKNFAAMPFTHKLAILGDMFEMGKYAEQEHKNILELCKQLSLKDVILVGDEFNKQIHKENGYNYLAFSTTQDAFTYLEKNPVADMNIFMKGSRGMKLETLVEVL